MGGKAGSALFIHLDTMTRGAEPLYLQIEKQIRRAVATGTLATGEMLPSVRIIANELGVSVQVVQHATTHLVKTGVIEVVRGIGMRVAAKAQGRPERIASLRGKMAEIVHLAKALDLGPDETRGVLEAALVEAAEAP